jgi:hypothetical protein
MWILARRNTRTTEELSEEDITDTSLSRCDNPRSVRNKFGLGSSLYSSNDALANQQPPKKRGWRTESGVGRMVYGMAHRVDRLKAIGNGQVPAVAVLAWSILSQ